MEALIPRSYEEISKNLAMMTPKSKIIGGGTDLVIRLKCVKNPQPDSLCYLGHIEELKKIEVLEDKIIIGAYCTMTQIEKHPVVREKLPALMDACSDVGSLQIRNNGTIGGNIGNASPAGDLIPVLYLYNAEVEVIGPEGTRIVPMNEIIERPGKTTLAYNEAVARIIIKYPEYKSAFVKLGSRKKVTIARITVAVGIKEENDKITEANICVGAISIKPVYLKKAEEFLVGKVLNEYNILQVAEYLSELIMEITPKEFDRDYKVFASKGVISDVFELILKR